MPKLNITLSSTGRSLKTLTGVLAPVALSSVGTTSGSNVITVASTTGIFPGMSIRVPGVPPGSVVHAVSSATQLELWRSVWNATTGVFSHSAANAQATATASGNTGHALAFDPQALVLNFYVDSTWRNLHSRSANLSVSPSSSTTLTTSLLAIPGSGMVPSSVTISASGVGQIAAATVTASDDLAATPLKRHDGQPHTCLLVVHTGGMLSVIHEPHTKDITYNGAD